MIKYIGRNNSFKIETTFNSCNLIIDNSFFENVWEVNEDLLFYTNKDYLDCLVKEHTYYLLSNAKFSYGGSRRSTFEVKDLKNLKKLTKEELRDIKCELLLQ